MNEDEALRLIDVALLLQKYARPVPQYTGKHEGYGLTTTIYHIMKLSRSLSALAVAERNRELSARQKTRQANIEAEINKILAEGFDGVTATFSGDPRGYVVKLHTPNRDYNTWGGPESGYGVA